MLIDLDYKVPLALFAEPNLRLQRETSKSHLKHIDCLITRTIKQYSKILFAIKFSFYIIIVNTIYKSYIIMYE